MSRADRAEGAPAKPVVVRPPSIDRMAAWPALRVLRERVGHKLLVEALRAWVETKRGTPEIADEGACALWCAGRLAPLAEVHGAAADNVRVVDDATGARLQTPFPEGTGERALDAARREATYRDLLRMALAQLTEARASEAVLRARVAAQADQLRHMLRVE